MRSGAKADGYVLGLDIGTNSVGWALIAERKGHPQKLVRLGSRVFEAGVEGDIETGKDKSRAVNRREARLRRRMLQRRMRRLRKLAHLLQGAGLLPSGDIAKPEMREQFFSELDGQLFSEDARKKFPHVLPYLLRARALDRKLAPHELGRAIYHLAHRRGFASNRKATSQKDENLGTVKEGIAKLSEEMRKSGARTLGEYFSRLNPMLERIRGRWTDRKMFKEEFEAIWKAQEGHHPDILTDELKKKVFRAIFFQRPIKWDRHMIGDCELENGRKRAPLCCLAFQRYRLLQKVNDLKIRETDPDTGMWIKERELADAERSTLIDALEKEGDLSFHKIRKLLGLSKTMKFNLEFDDDGDKKLIGNRTAAKLRKVFGDRWDAFTPAEKDRIVDDVRSIQDAGALERRGRKVHGLDDESAREFGNIEFEPDHANLSRQAIKRLLPLMERGLPYATARKEVYGDRPIPKPFDLLPSLDNEDVPVIRNPAVSRALTEVRKVVNAIVREDGKPVKIRVELARDLKKGRKERKGISRRNEEKRKLREVAVRKILEETGIQHPSGEDVEKWLLADECNWECPYTGAGINPKKLLGPAPEFDVEHIVPFSRCLDNSFLNKTLCYHEENRNVKRNRTPWEAYGPNPEKWEKILQRVRHFKGDATVAKLERFLLQDLNGFDDFTSRQLNDTRYASRLAIQYLGLLYGPGGGGIDADHNRCVQAGKGSVTKYIRDEYGLNRILNDGGEKSRDDHRHHAVDAVAIALADARMVKELSDAAGRAIIERRRRFGALQPPWPTFYDDVKKAVDALVVSHRVSRKVNGRIHEATYYGKLQKDPNGRECVHVRKRVESLSKNEVEMIIDPAIRKSVLDKLNGGDPKKVFADKKDHPTMKSGVPIHSVRIRVYDTTISIASGARQRRVQTGSNHHIEILECKDDDGNIFWDGVVVSTYEVMQRLKQNAPVVQRDHGAGKRFLFSLAGGEVVEMNKKDGMRSMYVVRTVPQSKQLVFVEIRDARPLKEIPKEGRTAYPESLRARNCIKIAVTPLGVIRSAND